MNDDLEDQGERLTKQETRFLIYMTICTGAVWLSGIGALVAIFLSMRP